MAKIKPDKPASKCKNWRSKEQNEHEKEKHKSEKSKSWNENEENQLNEIIIWLWLMKTSSFHFYGVCYVCVCQTIYSMTLLCFPIYNMNGL